MAVLLLDHSSEVRKLVSRPAGMVRRVCILTGAYGVVVWLEGLCSPEKSMLLLLFVSVRGCTSVRNAMVCPALAVRMDLWIIVLIRCM